MKKYISSIVTILAGAIIGAGVTNYILKKDYNDEVQLYSDDLYERRTKAAPAVSKKKEVPEESTDPAEMEYPVDDEEPIHTSNVHLRKEPYFIDDFEYREECKSYAKISLVLFQDLALIDDGEELLHLETIFKGLTPEVTDMFDLETVYVRNESISTDYEVVKSAKLYSEMYQ